MNLISELKKEFLDTYKYRRVIWSLAISTLRMRYKKSFLGFGWSMIGPLLNYAVIGIVFFHIAKFSIENFVLYLTIGATTYNFISVGLNLGSAALINNEHYIKKIYLPKSVFIFTGILMEGINYLLSITSIILVLGIAGRVNFSWTYLFLPIGFFIITTFIIGLGGLLSVACVFFRDLLHIIPVLLQAIFYITPIIYPSNQIPETMQPYIKFNFFFHFVELIRLPIHSNTLPSLMQIFITSTVSLIFFITGMIVLKIFDNKVVFKL